MKIQKDTSHKISWICLLIGIFCIFMGCAGVLAGFEAHITGTLVYTGRGKGDAPSTCIIIAIITILLGSFVVYAGLPKKGFSLIKMAIVLVIIGIIIATIIKGQGVVINSRVKLRAKPLVSTAKTWKASVYAYRDRNGRFPGDKNKSGTIANVSGELSAGKTAIDEITATMSRAPANPVVIGDQRFWFYLGNVTTGIATTNYFKSPRKVMVICKAADCKTVLSADDVELIKVLDTEIDRTADAGLGRVRAYISATGAGVTVVGAPGSANGRDNGYAALAIADVQGGIEGGTQVWSTTAAPYGVVWAFDKPFSLNYLLKSRKNTSEAAPVPMLWNK